MAGDIFCQVQAQVLDAKKGLCGTQSLHCCQRPTFGVALNLQKQKTAKRLVGLLPEFPPGFFTAI